MSKEKEIFNYLYEIGVCKACCLRYIFIRTPDVYCKIDEYITEKKYLTDCQKDEQQTKKVKSNACIVCLGLLQDFCINDTIDKISTNETVLSYDCNYFTCSVSYPACIQVREKSIRIDLEQKYPDFYTFDTQEALLNKVWKWMIRKLIADKLNKTFESSEISDFSINVAMGYELDTEELQVLLQMQPEYFNKRKIQTRKFNGEIFSRKGVVDVLSQTNNGVFVEHASVPPNISTKQVTCDVIECNHNSIYFAGRYCKYSRMLSQTPWVINGVRTMPSSVQEIIFEPFYKILNIPENGLKFSSSGREDVDVRCLGKGRPFYIEYLNPVKTNISFETFRQIEEEISKNQQVKVIDLQIVSRNDLGQIKTGEESKSKEYEAICVCKDGIMSDRSYEILNQIAPVILKQKTPIRVLHRRPLAVRERAIHSLIAEPIEGERKDLFKLKITTQAGTYVKEFVHGDFGRTKPSLENFINCEVDIISLDVVSINLDFPKSVIYA